MGISDRDYYRNEEPKGISLSGKWTAVGTIVFINVVVFLLVSLLFPKNPNIPVYYNPVFDYLALHFTLFERVVDGQIWSIAQLLSHGFLHGGFWHIAMNMFMLWMFGRDIEVIYGKKAFWRLYLSLIVLAGLFWVLTERYILHSSGIPQIGSGLDIPAVGASGAVAGVFLLFVFHFPKRTLYVMGILPVPAWVVGGVLLSIDMFGFHQAAAGTSSTNIAHAAHLGGVFFGYIFYRWHWTLFSVLPSAWFSKLSQGRRKTKLRLVRPLEEEDLDDKVDRILAKISRYGADSLSDEEYHTLETASRRAQRRRGAPMD